MLRSVLPVSRLRPLLLLLLVAAVSLTALPAAPAGASSTRAEPPTVVPRSEWDPKGECPVTDGASSRPERIHIHHTHEPVVNHPDETIPALQSICRSHRQRGFSEIGYHYLIDPYGTIWQARGPLPGEERRQVREGAHAQGFNDGSMGIALIGDFDLAPPSQEAVEAATVLAGWLAYEYGLDPEGTAAAVSGGGPSTRFDDGTKVDLPVVPGHRDTGAGTSCPGEHLYALLPEFRTAVAARVEALRAAAEADRAVAERAARVTAGLLWRPLLEFLSPA